MSADLSDLVGLVWLQSVARHGTDGNGLSASAATTMLMRLRELEAMEQRANAILATLNRTSSAHSVARLILGEK